MEAPMGGQGGLFPVKSKKRGGDHGHPRADRQRLLESGDDDAFSQRAKKPTEESVGRNPAGLIQERLPNCVPPGAGRQRYGQHQRSAHGGAVQTSGDSQE
jgi:hypothetical protein